MKPFICLIASILLLSCQDKQRTPDAVSAPDEPIPAAAAENLTEAQFLKYDHSSDTPYTKIKRPEHSFLKTKLDTTLLYNTWTTDPNGPSADFDITAKSFYLADYDGDGDLPYLLLGNTITLFYEDHIEDGEIILLKKDTLQIRWMRANTDVTYVTWPVD